MSIDDVELFDRRFDDNELFELQKIVAAASFQLKNGNVGDCYRQLESYWPRFLVTHVDPSTTPLARQATLPRRALLDPQPSQTESEDSPGLMERLKRMLPSFWR